MKEEQNNTPTITPEDWEKRCDVIIEKIGEYLGAGDKRRAKIAISDLVAVHLMLMDIGEAEIRKNFINSIAKEHEKISNISKVAADLLFYRCNTINGLSEAQYLSYILYNLLTDKLRLIDSQMREIEQHLLLQERLNDMASKDKERAGELEYLIEGTYIKYRENDNLFLLTEEAVDLFGGRLKARIGNAARVIVAALANERYIVDRIVNKELEMPKVYAPKFAVVDWEFVEDWYETITRDYPLTSKYFDAALKELPNYKNIKKGVMNEDLREEYESGLKIFERIYKPYLSKWNKPKF